MHTREETMKRMHQIGSKIGIWFLMAVISAAAFAGRARGEVAPVPATLSIRDAIERAIQTRLTVQLARAASQEARGRAIQAAAFLLPQVTGAVSQARVFKSNLAAQGFQASSFLPDP